MAISTRTVQNKRTANGEFTGTPGTVYDVNVKYRRNGKQQTYSKKGFLTKKEAVQHEAQMRQKLGVATFTPPSAVQQKTSVEEYLAEWIENHGTSNLRPSTFASYKSHLRNHIYPYIGHTPLRQLTPAILDDLYRQLSEKGLSPNSVKYTHRIISVAMEHARKYHYIDANPARDIITKFGKQGKTPPPYTVEQMRTLLGKISGTQWEIIIVLGGLYGLRMGEIIGLRWRNVDLENARFNVVEQIPFNLPSGTKFVDEMAPVKSSERTLPITESTKSCFIRQLKLQSRQKRLSGDYCNNDLVVALPNGEPEHRSRISRGFGQLLRHNDMPHMRFHDTRHTAATNMHELTGDIYTISQILGHSTKGIASHLDIQTGISAVTAGYVDVRLERKQIVLNTYHRAIYNDE